MKEVEHSLTWKGCILNALIVVAIMGAIGIGVPYILRQVAIEDRKKVDKNGSIVHGYIYKKSYSKLKSVSFEYFFDKKKYRSYQSGREFFDLLEVGDSIEVKLENSDPENAYIFSGTTNH